MDRDIVESIGIYGGALAFGIISSVLPFMSAEVFIATIVVAYTRSIALICLLATLVSVGHILAKIPMYYAARGATRLAKPDPKGRIARVKAWIERWKKQPVALTLLSATTGIPPFYVIAFLAGMLEMKFRTFLAVGLLGRIVRYATVGIVAAQV